MNNQTLWIAFFTTAPLQILCAVLLDWLVGDPRQPIHLARITGWLASRMERGVVRLFHRTIVGGLIFFVCITAGMVSACYLVGCLMYAIHPLLWWLWGVLLIYQSVAARDMIDHLRAVLVPLKAGELSDARAKLSWIVGRDTRQLDETECARATIEAGAESLNDGYAAPLFWAAVLGPAGAVVYRVVNTLDSMVGHRDERYEKFGKVAARMDDLLNWVPARWCAVVSEGLQSYRNWDALKRDAAKHASPNAGWPEAAAAYYLNVRLGGTNVYDGVAHEGPMIHESGESASVAHVEKLIHWFILMSALLVVKALIVSTLVWIWMSTTF